MMTRLAYLQMIENSLKSWTCPLKDRNGHWTAPLPFKEQRAILPNNKVLALKRAYSLDVSLKKNPTKRDHMVTFMKGIIDRGAADVAPPIPEDKEYM